MIGQLTRTIARPIAGPRTNQRGLSSGVLLAVIAIASALLAGASTLTTVAHTSLAQEIGTTRVLRAAQAGVDWGRFQVLKSPAPACAATTTVTINWASGPIPVTVRCTEQLPATDENGTPVRVFQITATACTPAPTGACPDAVGNNGYLQRRLSALASR